MEVFGSLASGVAHDFNNLLTPILGFTELALIKDIDDEETREDLEQIRTAAMRARALTQQILNFSRRDATPSGNTQIGYLIREVVGLLRVTHGNSITISTEIDSDLPPIRGDATQLQTVLMNLCVNAAQATPRGGTIEIAARVVTREHQDYVASIEETKFVRVDVKDCGVGMDDHVMQRLFEPYFTTKADTGGTGQGLATVRSIVDMLGGEIDARSVPGQGSCFSVLLPSSTQALVPLQARVPMPWGNGGEVLLAGRQLTIMECCRQHLEFFGYRVTSVDSNSAAIERIAESGNPYRIVLTDDELGDVTGLQLAGQLRALGSDLPVILMTGATHAGQAHVALEQGVTHILAKPFTLEELAEAIAVAQKKPTAGASAQMS